jgi:hypothetical protein
MAAVECSYENLLQDTCPVLSSLHSPSPSPLPSTTLLTHSPPHPIL